MARRTKEEAELTRQSLLKAGLNIFSRNGYTAATLEDVAKEAGVTRGAIYWHFGSKAELFAALLNEHAGNSAEIVQSAAAEGGGLVDILKRVFVRLMTAVENDRALKEVMEITLFKTERSPDLAEVLEQRQESDRQLIAGIAAVMRQGIASGELRPDIEPLDMARAFLALQNGTFYLWFQDPGSFSLKEIAPALAEIFLQGIVRR